MHNRADTQSNIFHHMCRVRKVPLIIQEVTIYVPTQPRIKPIRERVDLTTNIPVREWVDPVANSRSKSSK